MKIERLSKWEEASYAFAILTSIALLAVTILFLQVSAPATLYLLPLFLQIISVLLYTKTNNLLLALSFSFMAFFLWLGVSIAICAPVGLLMAAYEVPYKLYVLTIATGTASFLLGVFLGRCHNSLNKLLQPTANASVE